jgi:DNA repair protein RecN (Recombination protein N)
MLTTLSIRDVILIERLDLEFGPGLTVLTGETGAGKSILLDSLGLALGARAEAALVRTGAEQAAVTACFAPPADHPALAVLAEQGFDADGELVLRRVVSRDGKSRAFVNDQPAGVTLLRRVGAMLVEVQGQHDQIGLADPASHISFLDSVGVPAHLRDQVKAAWQNWKDIEAKLCAAREAVAAAARDEAWLRHAVEELAALAPEPDEEERLAEERRRLQQVERQGEAIAAAVAELTPRDRRSAGPASALRAASRALQRVAPANSGDAGSAAPALAALERAEEALAEAETLLARLADEAATDPRRLERAEERLFALRAIARKHQVTVDELATLLHKLQSRLASLEQGEGEVNAFERATAEACAAFRTAAASLSKARGAAASDLERAVARELPPLRLDKARFVVAVTPLAEENWGPAGCDQVRFLIATNPGQEPQPLGRIASGGELSRLMLALRVVLSSGSTRPTLVFDEVDSGIGGATAAAVGDRLARLSEHLQVLVVTHSPQVAARGIAHLRVSKAAARGRSATRVESLNARTRREEIARMLAGETVTEAARAAADDLLATA